MKFNEGAVVIIADSSLEYKQRYIGKTGIVESTYRTGNNGVMYGVRFKNLRNPVSSKGLFWFRAKSLSLSNPKNSVTNESEEIPMFENYVVAEVQFLDNPVPVHFFALYDSTIEPGDTVVVHTGHHGFSLAKVYAIDPNPESKKKVNCGREVVCKVDFSAYNARKDALRRASELRKQMDAKLHEVQTMAIYEMFAEKDSDLKAMLDEFKTLSNLINGATPESEVTHVKEAHEAV